MKGIQSGLLLLLLFCFACPVSAQDVQPIQVEELAKTTESWDGNRLPAYPEGQPEITILKISIAPDEALPIHKHPYINAGILVKGELTVETEDGDTLILDTGDTIVELVGKWHFGKNSGEEPAEIIVFYAGIEEEPITVQQ